MFFRCGMHACGDVVVGILRFFTSQLAHTMRTTMMSWAHNNNLKRGKSASLLLSSSRFYIHLSYEKNSIVAKKTAQTHHWTEFKRSQQFPTTQIIRFFFCRREFLFLFIHSFDILHSLTTAGERANHGKSLVESTAHTEQKISLSQLEGHVWEGTKKNKRERVG